MTADRTDPETYRGFPVVERCQAAKVVGRVALQNTR